MPGKTILPDPRQSPRYSGLCTFCRYPRLADVAPENSPVDWAIYGVPFDGGVTYRPGARFGPRSIREESQYVKRYSIEHDVDVCSVLSLADAGDAPVRPFSCGENARAVHEFAMGLGKPSSTRLFAVGGDHSIAYANIKATWERRGKPAGGLPLIHFDSHLDTVDSTMGESWSHASPFIRAIQDGLVDPGRMISLGIKGPLNTASDLDFARRHGITMVTHGDYAREGASRLDDFVRSLAGAEAYLTFDIDCVDPAYAPGTGTPSVGGFTSAEALALIRGLRGANIVGADVVEVLPDRDVSGITALLAAHVIFEVLCLDAVRRTNDSQPAGRQHRSASKS
ncbi:MAG: agmatinase [Phycisphaeraceae bacterium]|nr:agmatinase [Phycisphaeraceae bacterium]